MTEQISPFKALDFIRDNAQAYAQAKANVVYMMEYRKSLKAILMQEATDLKTESAKETYAYANQSYIDHLKAIQQAVEQAEKLRWLLVSAEAKITVWRSLEASNRMEANSTT